MKIIGVTGGTGAGKSVLSKALKKYGATVIDADKISKEVSAVGGLAYDEIVLSFGKDILKPCGEIDRSTLAKIVFSDAEKLELLEDITHKYIFKEIQKQLNDCKTETVVLDAALLFDCEFKDICDVKVAVIAEPDVRIKRIMSRDNISMEMAKARMKNQITNEEYSELADICFINNGDLAKVEEFAKSLLA